MSQFIDFAALERLPSRKSYLLAPSGVCENSVPDGPGELFRCPADELLLSLRTHLEIKKGVKHLQADIDQRALRYVAVTPTMKFKDDIDIRVFDRGHDSVMASYSRSRIGYGDMGANKKRVLSLIAELRAG